ncbi:MAG TPA: hypothetical protein PLL65_12460 [Phycisphaerae bacterium]|nr:hypothetical protein [Phycisphaerae bacterium]
MKQAKRWGRTLVGLLLLVALPSCQDIWINSIYPLGSGAAGGRGTIEVVFDNQTPYRAIFTFGSYDPQDQTSEPIYGQFAVDPDQDPTPFNRGLDPDTVTPRRSFAVNCGRVFSLGGQTLINRIQAADLQPFNNAPVIEAALRTGIYFTAAPLDDPDANAVEKYAVRADPVMSLLGVDYSCDSLLVYTLRLDPENSERVIIDLSVVPAEEE